MTGSLQSKSRQPNTNNHAEVDFMPEFLNKFEIDRDGFTKLTEPRKMGPVMSKEAENLLTLFGDTMARD